MAGWKFVRCVTKQKKPVKENTPLRVLLKFIHNEITSKF